MKPNDKAIEAALAAILKAMAERNCIIAGVPFNETNYDEFDASEAVEHSKVALDAAYAAQFQSEDYAGLVERLRLRAGIFKDTTDDRATADAIEALLAEREAWKGRHEATAAILKRVEAERDALAARLAICERMMDKEYRDAFTVADNSNTVAAQIVSMRHSRKWTQKELAEKCGMHQPQISALEDPDFENFEVATLQRVASAFDVALLVRFVRFSELARLAPVEASTDPLTNGMTVTIPDGEEKRLAVAPVEDEALVEIMARTNYGKKWDDPENGPGEAMKEVWRNLYRKPLAAVRPHIEAAERERCAKKILETNWVDADPEETAAAIRRG
jgi:transcriptional regulator with XRE-family HTH domain